MSRIYHYTSIESLALILKTRKLRFSRLDGVDDVKEAQRHAEIDFGKFFFVSCWTQQEEESIPQWSMYSREMKGVRIETPSYPFIDEPLRPKPGWEGIIWEGKILSPLSFESIWRNGYFIAPMFLNRDHFAGAVEYVDNIEDEYSNSIQRKVDSSGHVNLKIDRLPFLPRKKSRDWAFQKEYRFSLFVLPSLPLPDGGPGIKEFSEQIAQHMSNSFINNVDPGITYVDVPLSDEALKNLVVCTGPLMTPGDFTCVEALLNSYAPEARIEESSLRGAIRARQ